MNCWLWRTIFVISEGRLVHETTPAAADLVIIGRKMAGHEDAAIGKPALAG